MFVVGMVVMVFGIIAIICVSVAGAPKIVYIVYAGLMSLVFMVVSDPFDECQTRLPVRSVKLSNVDPGQYFECGTKVGFEYLAIDIQMLMGGKKYEISPEDYIFAAAQIFLDIVNLFLLLLQIVGFARFQLLA